MGTEGIIGREISLIKAMEATRCALPRECSEKWPRGMLKGRLNRLDTPPKFPIL